MAKYDAHAIVLKYDADGMPTWTTIGQIRDMEGPAHMAEVIDSTTHDSSNHHRDYVAGLLDSGDVTFELAYDPALTAHEWMRDNTGISKDFQLIFPDSGSTTWTFSGIITNFTPKAPVDGLLTCDVTIKVTTDVSDS